MIVFGLGNPGTSYRHTRHNVGFMCIDLLAARLGIRVGRRDHKSLVGDAPRPGHPASSVLLAKPQTYMNLSGRAAAPLLHKHGLETRDLWVVYDELDLPFGKLRIRKTGSAGGHNGVDSLIEELGTGNFPRFRVGIGRPSGGDPVDHLLTDFDPEQRERLPDLISLAAEAIAFSLEAGIDEGMNRYNGKSV